MEYKELLNFIEFVKNPEAFEAKLLELQAEQKRLQENIEATIKLGDLNRLYDEAQKTAQASESILAEAKAQAETIVTAAKHSYDARLAELEKRMQVLAESEKATAQALANANLHAAEAKKVTKSLKDAQGAVILERQTLAAAQAEVDARLEKLKAVMG